jgi:ADP-heptose:LPS heptosyltransferase
MKKILVIQFKYFGDAVFLAPALLAIKDKFPNADIHLLVANEIAPIFNNLKYIKKIWAVPRKRGKFNLFELLPFIRALRTYEFDRVVDFGGNDRGAIFSLLSGSKIRLGLMEGSPKLLQKICYTVLIDSYFLSRNNICKNFGLVKSWGIQKPYNANPIIISSLHLKKQAKTVLKGRSIICHLGTSQPKKEWPINKWQELYFYLRERKMSLAFSSGNSDRERALLYALKKLEPSIFILPAINDLELYLAVLNEAKLVISGDTAPLHFANALGIKVIGLFGTHDSKEHAAPIYSSNKKVMSKSCLCVGDLAHYETCMSKKSCMESIKPNQVLRLINLKQ